MVKQAVVRFHWWWSAIMVAFLAASWLPDVMVEIRTRTLLREHAIENYMTVNHVSVGNSVAGQNVELEVAREIKQDFLGSYTVEVRRFPSREVVCTANDTLAYKTTSSLPETITLEWWSNDAECSGRFLAPGDYIITTTWVVHIQAHGIPEPALTIESNPFTVTAVAPSTAAEAIQQQQTILQRIEQLERRLEGASNADD